MRDPAQSSCSLIWHAGLQFKCRRMHIYIKSVRMHICECVRFAQVHMPVDRETCSVSTVALQAADDYTERRRSASGTVAHHEGPPPRNSAALPGTAAKICSGVLFLSPAGQLQVFGLAQAMLLCIMFQAQRQHSHHFQLLSFILCCKDLAPSICGAELIEVLVIAT